MTRITLLQELKKFTENALRDLLQPYRRESKMVKNPETGEQEKVYKGAELQPVRVFLHRLPDKKELRTAPCILHQIVTGKDFIDERGRSYSIAVVRTGFCAYGESEADSGSLLLNMMERLRIALLTEQRLAQGQFMLDTGSGLETLVYTETDETTPYALGEMISTWYIPPIKRELKQIQ